MSEIYGDFSGILDVAQEVSSIVGRETVWENYTGYKTVNTTRGIYAPLAAAKTAAGKSRSLVKYGFVDDAEELCRRAQYLTDKLAQLATFLTWLVEQLEQADLDMIMLLDKSGMLSKKDKAWIEDYRNPLGTRYEGGWFQFDAITGEADVYSAELCLYRSKMITTKRDNEGRRVSNVDLDVKAGCIAIGAGGRSGRIWGDLNTSPLDRSMSSDAVRENIELNRIPRTNENGPNSDGIILNATAGSVEVGGDVNPYVNERVNASYGKGVAIMYTSNEDGTYSVSLGAGKSPIGGTSTVNVTDAQREPERRREQAEAERKADWDRAHKSSGFRETMTRPLSESEDNAAARANDPAWRAYWAGMGPKPYR